MRAFVTYDELKGFGAEVETRQLIKEASSRSGKTVFLSHSSADDDILPGALRVLEGHGGRVYVDKKDPALKEMEIFDIAERLRSTVGLCKRFVLLVTPKTKDSRWIPWELGLGDARNTPASVALFPSAETAYEQTWSEQEYLGLYQRIIWGNFSDEEKNQWIVLNHRENTGRKLSEWLGS